jgi:ADP-heptose:LPS heptosyltransferase
MKAKIPRPRLLVVEMHHLGDAVMAMPFLRAAMRDFDVHVACRAPVAKMLAAWMPDIGLLSGGWWRVTREARKLKPAVAACVWADSRAQWVMAVSGARLRAGFPMNEANYYAPDWPWRQRRLRAGIWLARLGFAAPGGRLLTHPVQRADREQHHLTSWEALAQTLELNAEYDTPWFHAPPCPEEAAEFCDSRRTQGYKILVLHAGARLPTKIWPAERFTALLARLAKAPKLAVLVVHPPDESPPHPSGSNQRVFMTPSFDALAGTINRGDIFLGNDSFAAHVAAALGKPTLAIFGSGNPHWFAPGGDFRTVIATSACPHRPCIDRCVMPATVCLETITPEIVEYRLREVLSHR